ncbi:MAG: hypothetical protein IPF54_20130 [Draconibacterium sp.]|nr:hypothetical protein [Draconibacterium sp.]
MYTQPGDSTSIESGALSCIIEDKDSTLWVATKNGVCTFNYKTEKFNRVFNADSENTIIKNLFLTGKNDLFVISTKGTFKYNRKLDKFEKFFQTSVDLEASVMVGDNQGHFYFGTWGNCIIYWDSIRNDYFTELITAKNSLNDENNIESLVIDKKGYTLDWNPKWILLWEII